MKVIIKNPYSSWLNRILNRRDRQKIKVRIDPYDTWSMDHTLAHIIVPMLKQLKDTKHGAPLTDQEDRPEHLKSEELDPNDGTDKYHFEAWDWILDEMIWSFEQKTRDDWAGDYYEFEDDPTNPLGIKIVWSDFEGRIAHQRRMTNGFRLFGKYYESLWD